MKLKLATKQRIATTIQAIGFHAFAISLIVLAASVDLWLGAATLGGFLLVLGIVIDIYTD